MIAEFHEKRAPVYKLYGLNLVHKHIPELQAYIGSQRRPLFVPSVGNYRQGMLVSVPLHLDLLRENVDGDMMAENLRRYYSGCDRVHVEGPHYDSSLTELEPEALNGTDDLELHVFARNDLRHAVLVARLDNLGMGAAGTAVRNLRLMTRKR
jgi:N-acetyl-gamma-glutamyl-phosphate reductase